MALLYSEPLTVGWEAAGFSLKDTDENMRTLRDFNDKKGLLIIFTCNHCPYAQAAWPLTVELHQSFGRDIAFIAINPNDEINYPDDSFEQMKVKVRDWNVPFPYLRDETQEVARAYKAQHTPDIYLFKREDGSFKLYYHGRINDNWQNPDQVKERNLEKAMHSLINNQPPPSNQPPSMGCSIKWK